MALALFALVAVVAEFDTFPAVDIVASLESAIAAEELISAFTIKEVNKVPLALVCTTPALFNPLIVTFPDPSIFILSLPFVSNERVFAVAADIPVLVLPEN